ncbi:unnamed protein product [Lota lota]
MPIPVRGGVPSPVPSDSTALTTMFTHCHGACWTLFGDSQCYTNSSNDIRHAMMRDVYTSGLACAGLSDSSTCPPMLAVDQSMQRRLAEGSVRVEGRVLQSVRQPSQVECEPSCSHGCHDALQQQPSKYRTLPPMGGRGKNSPPADGEAGPLRDSKATLHPGTRIPNRGP